MTATLDVTDLRKQFCGRPPGHRRRELRRAGRRDRRPARALGLRQDHDACAASPASSTRPRGDHLHRRAGGVGARARHAGAAAAAQHRHGVPVLCGLAAHDGAAERRSIRSSTAKSRAPSRPQGRRGAGARRPVRICRPSGGRAVGRADAARGAGAQPRLPAAVPAARRAARPISMPSCACGCATICDASSSRPA